MNKASARGLIGLCQRAGKLQTGADLTAKAIKNGSCRLALLDGGAAANTVKKITDACIYYHVPCLTLPSGMLDGNHKITFRIVADYQYQIDSLTVDGTDVPEAMGKSEYDLEYTFTAGSGGINLHF